MKRRTIAVVTLGTILLAGWATREIAHGNAIFSIVACPASLAIAGWWVAGVLWYIGWGFCTLEGVWRSNGYRGQSSREVRSIAVYAMVHFVAAGAVCYGAIGLMRWTLAPHRPAPIFDVSVMAAIGLLAVVFVALAYLDGQQRFSEHSKT